MTSAQTASFHCLWATERFGALLNGLQAQGRPLCPRSRAVMSPAPPLRLLCPAPCEQIGGWHRGGCVELRP